jgi:hypothetical protein
VAARYEMACTAAAKYSPVGVAMPLVCAAAVYDKSGLVIVAKYCRLPTIDWNLALCSLVRGG